MAKINLYKDIDTIGFYNNAAPLSKLLSYLEIIINDRNVTVFPDMGYIIEYYDYISRSTLRRNCLVLQVYKDQIKVKYELIYDNDINYAEITPCHCILNPPNLDMYKKYETMFIPIQNILDIRYMQYDKNDKPDNDKKEDVKVVLLGISATMVKAIIVRLEFFDDNSKDYVKLVDLEVNGIYDITYKEKNGSIFESRARVIKIEDDKHYHECKPSNSYVRENVGFADSIYTMEPTSKKDFMSNAPARKIKIIVDTSEDLAGRYEEIILDSIIDCNLVQKPDGDRHEDNSNNHKSDKSSFLYNYENANVKVEGEEISIMIDGKNDKISMDDLLKFYLGID